MRQVAVLPQKDRDALFRNTAVKTGMSEAVVEKDFWVCFMLDYLFHRCPWKGALAFKGGTSLSKAYGLIARFSEDIDLILDWRVLGYGIEEPWLERSVTKQDRFNKEADERAARFLAHQFLPALIEALTDELLQPIHCHIEQTDGQTIRFSYPSSFSDQAILREIRLEIGALAAWTPAKNSEIRSYAAETYPFAFEQPSTSIRTVLPERTFWEKATILHREAFRPENTEMPGRYSRHYYDLYEMAKTDAKDNALRDMALLAKVVAFKYKFYHCSWARYDLAVPGSLRLMPPEARLKALKEDYDHMQNMLFGEKPRFEALMSGIAKLEEEINQRT